MGLFDMFNYDPVQQNQGYSGMGFGGQSFDFPGQAFKDDSMSSYFQPQPTNMGQLNPTAQQSYLDFLSAGAPSREDFKQPLWQQIVSGLGAAAAGWNSKDPNVGLQSYQQMRDMPYLQALQDFQIKGKNLGNAADVERSKLGLERQFSNDAFTQAQAGKELGFKETQLAQQGTLENRGLDIKEKSLEQQMEQNRLDRALQEQKISIDQYQAATQRLNANTNQGEATTRAKYYEDLIKSKKDPNAVTPSASLIEQQYGARVMSDPTLATYLTPDGNFKPGLKNDPVAMERLRQIQREVGLLPKDSADPNALSAVDQIRRELGISR